MDFKELGAYAVNYLETHSGQAINFVVSLVCAVAGILDWIFCKNRTIVMEHSTYYKGIQALNERTKFHREIARNGSVYYTMQVNSKAEYDKTAKISALYEYLGLYSEEMKAYLHQVSENRRAYSAYISAFEKISSTITPEECEKLRIKYEKFCKIERCLVDASKLDIIRELTIICDVEYTSPKGQRHYKKGCTFLESEIRTAMKQIETRTAYMQSEAFRRKNERGKVTPSLRYDVMRRDGFRCCLCGRTATNGVELEVDHIIPVAKGGNTTYSNLQTLCRDCNRGKGTK
jgi:5-methylcytosine-specific restriction endonuclease McrA